MEQFLFSLEDNVNEHSNTHMDSQDDSDSEKLINNLHVIILI